MKLQVSRLIAVGLTVSVFVFLNPVCSFSKKNVKTESVSDIVEKINELKSIEKIIDNKINILESEKKKLEEEKKALEKERLATDKYVKDQKKELDNYVNQKKQELESLKKRIASERIKKLSSIYANAKPQAAAAELAKMNEDVAAEILVFMQPRKAGAIISKMDPAAASKIFQKYLSKQKESKLNKQ